MSNLEARRAFYGRPCPNHDLTADFAWWGTHAVQPWRPSHVFFGKVEIGSRIWKLPVENFRAQLRSKCLENIWRNACVQVPSIWNFGNFLEKFGSFKTALTRIEGGVRYAWYCYMLNRIKQIWAKNAIHIIRELDLVTFHMKDHLSDDGTSKINVRMIM